jgi:protein SCO1/2
VGLRRRALVLLVAVAVVPAAAAAKPPQEPLPIELGGPFSLVDQDGKRRTAEDFRGTHMLIFFGYASCKGMCPLGLSHMVAAVDALGSLSRRIQPVFISVDPARDTPAALSDRVRKIHPRLVGLTGTPDEVRAVMRAYRVEARVIGRFADGQPIFSHGTFVYLVGPDGRFLTLFPPIMGGAAMAAAIRRYLPVP